MQRLTRAKIEHLIFLGVIAIIVVLYFFDAWRVSHRVENLVLIVPFGIAALILCGAVAVGLLASKKEDETLAAEEVEEAHDQTWWERLVPLTVLVLIGAYSFLLESVGFDVVTFTFVVLCLFVLGERNYLRLIGFSAVFTFVVVWGAKSILTFPIPTLLR